MGALLAACLAPDRSLTGPVEHRALPPRVVIIKADDLYPTAWASIISPGWSRFFAFADSAQVAVTAGVIWGRDGGPAWDSILVRLHRDSLVELWHHGWDHALAIDGDPQLDEFRGTGFDHQALHLFSGVRRAAALGIPVTTFGAPGNAIDAGTDSAMTATPELRIWFFGDPAWRGGLVLPRSHEVLLEPATGQPDFQTFLASYAAQDTLALLILQLHPASYDSLKEAAFEQAVAYLRSAGWSFLTAQQYAEAVAP